MIHSPIQNLKHLETIVDETLLVAVIGKKPDELTVLGCLDFKDSYDELDLLVFSYLLLSKNTKIALIHHRYSPGTDICVDHNQHDIPSVLAEVVERLDLAPDELTWIHPEHEKPLFKLFGKSSESRGLVSASKFELPENLVGANLSNSCLKRIDLRNRNLAGADFRNAELSFASFQSSDLQGVDFYDADLRQVNFQDADLQRANLAKANLEGANLENCNLTGCNLEGANLQRAKFRIANLTTAHLNGSTSLENANFEGANFDHISCDSQTMWFNIIGLHRVKDVPDELRRYPNFIYGVSLSEAIESLTCDENAERFKEIYKHVLSKIRDAKLAASLWNKMAWLSSLYDCVDDESFKAAKEATRLVPSKGNYHDTLGLILTLRKDYDEAIKEFEKALELRDIKEHWPESFIKRRKGWIKDLKSGKINIDEDILEVLRVEEY